jgi:hypothetical protein
VNFTVNVPHRFDPPLTPGPGPAEIGIQGPIRQRPLPPLVIDADIAALRSGIAAVIKLMRREAARLDILAARTGLNDHLR